MALTGFANLLFVRNKENEAERLRYMAAKLVNAIENAMWYEKDRCYVDIKSDRLTGNESRGILCQDIVFYVFAMTDMLPQTVPNNSKLSPHASLNKENNMLLIDDKRGLKIKEIDPRIGIS